MPTVLAVDDTKALRDFVQFTLSGFAGIKVEEAADGGTALRMLNEQRFDLMVTDLFLPVLDGMQVLALMRQQGLNRETPVIMMTADTRPRTQIDAAKRGAHSVLVKPFRCDDLIAATKSALGMVDKPTPGSEQRRETRLRIPVEIAIPGDSVLICTTWDITPYGAFVACESPPLHTQLTLSVMLPSGRVDVPAQIVHTRDYPSGPLPAGFGCKFADDPTTIRRLLEAFTSPEEDDAD